MRKQIDKILEKILIILMILLVTDVIWQVLSRYLNKFMVNYSITQIPTQLYAFTDELAGFLLIWVALLGSAYATGNKEHLAINLLENILNTKGKRILNITINSIILIFSFLVLIIGGTWLVYTRFYLGQVSAAMQIPIGVVYAILPISGILICYYSVTDLLISKKIKN